MAGTQEGHLRTVSGHRIAREFFAYHRSLFAPFRGRHRTAQLGQNGSRRTRIASLMAWVFGQLASARGVTVTEAIG